MINEISERYEIALQEKEAKITELNSNIKELMSNLTIIQNENLNLNASNEKLKGEMEKFTLNMKSDFTREMNDHLITAEIRKVKDPSSFTALRSLMTKMNKMKLRISSLEAQLTNETKRAEVVQEKGNSIVTKNKEISSQVKALREAVDSLKTRNGFLLNELEHSQRKLRQYQSHRGEKGSASNPVQEDSDGYYQRLVQEICSILSIETQENLINQIKTIENAYQFLPSLQSTVETIFKTVMADNIFDTPINSYDVLSP